MALFSPQRGAEKGRNQHGTILRQNVWENRCPRARRVSRNKLLARQALRLSSFVGIFDILSTPRWARETILGKEEKDKVVSPPPPP